MKQVKPIIAVLSITLLVFFLNNCSIKSKRKGKNAWSIQRLKGNVQSFQSVKYDGQEKFGEPIKASATDFEKITFNKEGNMLESEEYTNDKSTYYKKVMKYDSIGQNIETNLYKLDGSLARKFLYDHDSNGNTIEQNIFEPNGTLSDKYKFIYDENGNELESTFYHSDGTLKSKLITKYDGQGNAIEMSSYSSNRTLDNRIISTYDEKGNPIAEDSYNENGEVIMKVNYKYEFDGKGNWTKRIETASIKPFDSNIIWIEERDIKYY
ncbi:MAG: hypothetical protein NT126_03945 [Bacteroidetes bacterium]|nr:hypothetical protein [Bacteroidota bacterium]